MRKIVAESPTSPGAGYKLITTSLAAQYRDVEEIGIRLDCILDRMEELFLEMNDADSRDN